MKTGVIILAGGKGLRLGRNIPKQFIKIGKDNKMIIEHTISKFEMAESINKIVVVGLESHIDYIKTIVLNNNFTKVQSVVVGGIERQNSVYNGINELKDMDIIMVHDGVRPFIKVFEIEEIIKLTKKYGSVVIGNKVKDTIKICQNNIIIDTPNREELLSVQTPQSFKSQILINAHKEALENNFIGTDESSLVERIGESVYVYEGSYDNIKITTEIDIILGNSLIDKS